MKKILFISSYSLETEAAVRNRLLAYINEGLRSNFSITLISADDPSYTLLYSKHFSHIKVPSTGKLGSNFLKRTLTESIRAYRVLMTARGTGIEHVVITIPSMFLLFQNLLLRKKHLYMDVRDVTWEYLSDHSLITRIAKRIFEQLARATIKYCSLAMVTNTTELNYLQHQLKFPSARLLLISNGVSQDQFNILSSTGAKRSHKDETPVVSYIGNVGLAQNLKILVEVAKTLPTVQFNVYGTGTDFDKVSTYRKEIGAQNVKFFGRISWNEVIEAYRNSDILYAQLSKEYSGAMPSKLYEYLSTGKYVLYGGGAQARSILSAFENNLIITPDDPSSLSTAITTIIREKRHKQYSQKNIEKIKKDYIREYAVLRFYKKLQENQNSPSFTSSH